MFVTITELKKNFNKYLDITKNEDVYITKNGTVIAKLIIPESNKLGALKSLYGIAKGKEDSSLKDISLDAIKEERLSRQ